MFKKVIGEKNMLHFNSIDLFIIFSTFLKILGIILCISRIDMFMILSASLQISGILLTGGAIIVTSKEELMTSVARLEPKSGKVYCNVKLVKSLEKNKGLAFCGIVYSILSLFFSDKQNISFDNIKYIIIASIIIIYLTDLIIAAMIKYKYSDYKKYYELDNYKISDNSIAFEIEENEIILNEKYK